MQIEQWADDKTGYPCLACFTRDSHWCGYVALPESHPFYNRAYNEKGCPPDLHAALMRSPLGKRSAFSLFSVSEDPAETAIGELIDVHGGVTFSGDWKNKNIPGFWWGFDCAHAGDKTPYSPDGEFRDLDYVKAECASMAYQLAQIAG